MDLVAIGNGIGAGLENSQLLLAIAMFSIVFALLFVSRTGRRLREQVHTVMFTNWRLALLGATGIVLSLASGWTTWDGMRNFTQEPVLSLMITFGIQGVMLIVAWLIGESFATGMNFRPAAAATNNQGARPFRAVEPFAGTAIGVAIFAALVLLVLNLAGGRDQFSADAANASWLLVPSGLLVGVIVILFGLTLLLNSGSDIVANYLQAVRVIARSAVLWVMFLACMATSVFFSFDSLFSTIFPQSERVRAADLRAQNQVAGVITDIGALAARRRLEERDLLFETDGWQRYDDMLEQLVVIAQQAPQALRAYFEKKMRDKQKLVAQRQEEKAAAESQQVGLNQRSKLLNEEIARNRTIVSQLSPVVSDLKSKIFAKDQEIVAKTAEAEAEAGGIGVTAKSGRGPQYRQIMAERRVLSEHKKNLELQLREFDKRLNTARDRVSQGEAQLSTAQGEIATLQGRAHTAAQLIQLANQNDAGDKPAFDPISGLRRLQRARIAFRQEPTRQRLAEVQDLCATLVAVMVNVPTFKAQSSRLDCDPGEANAAAGRVFALNTGLAVLAANCSGGDKLPKTGGADRLFAFARKCVQDAGLPSKDTDALRTQINYLELNRDDKAHRFVVTTNAFGDGNKLAYLALAIAIAIDALVFMSGLFGANVVRSPLSDVPSHKGRTARQLEAIIDTALQPHPYDTARLVLGQLRPITPEAGFTAEITVEDGDPHAGDLRRVLNAGSSIGAVRHGDNVDRVYKVRSEFFEYLSIAAQREYEKDNDRVKLAEMEKTVTAALLPQVATNADIVLDYMQPMLEQHGFMAEIKLDEVVDAGHRKIVRSALNAGTAYARVQRVKNSSDHYFIHADFFKALTGLRGRLLTSAAAIAGGRLAAAPTLQHASAIDSDGAARQGGDQPDRLPANFNEQIRLEMLYAIDVDAQLFELARQAGGQAVSARRTVERITADDDAVPAIGGKLDDEMDEAVERLRQTNDLLLTRHGGNPEAAQRIAQVHREIFELLPIFMMYPGGKYDAILKSIISELENAAQDDNGLGPGEQEVLDRLRTHAAAFAATRDIDSALAVVDQYLTTPEHGKVVSIHGGL